MGRSYVYERMESLLLMIAELSRSAVWQICCRSVFVLSLSSGLHSGMLSKFLWPASRFHFLNICCWRPITFFYCLWFWRHSWYLTFIAHCLFESLNIGCDVCCKATKTPSVHCILLTEWPLPLLPADENAKPKELFTLFTPHFINMDMKHCNVMRNLTRPVWLTEIVS